MLAEFRQQLHNLPRGLRTRFAPSPTGYLHLGHAASAVFVWGIAKAIEADVVLRIEDHDRGRVRPEYEKAILEDLTWLGLIQTPDFFRQSDHWDRYQSKMEEARARGLIYACTCSRREIQERTGEESRDELRYDGHCRFLGRAESQAGLRLQLDDRAFAFHDLWAGPQVQKPHEQCGDLLIRDRDGNWTYNFAVSVDDAAEGVDLIIRGQDLLTATGRQLQLRSLFGITQPIQVIHHPLIWESPERKLSKRDGSTSLRHLREQGQSPAMILGQAAFSVGLLDRPQPLAAHELKGLFA
ncbi:MAG TPA: glutamate--tRNA ligase family protein [Oligoflexus sp.]|uniref:glutamate--tRNA ligase family protein n=1 Tax=Oligoflexus sp. TaxID=1971216 RepID=UPI002D5F7F9D|nr:glutamate--tRNA ligase family protein [Oligoflexus sp.]HYX33012.1 glutamate--tRNA ligase family protein [Oligoflexus sp.]